MKKIVIIIITIIISIPLGGVVGFILGLMSTTFIPSCCDDNGCHNCLEFRGLIGYEASAVIGFGIGLVLIPLIYISLLVYLKSKNKI